VFNSDNRATYMDEYYRHLPRAPKIGGCQNSMGAPTEK